MSISVIIITKNESEQIEACITTCLLFSEVLVVDAYSTDSTASIAKSLGARVLSRTWTNFSDQKQFAVENAQYDWILSVDADERISRELANEITALDLNLPELAFQIPRRNYFLGRPIRFSGWGNDMVIRLFNRKIARFNGRLVHEKVDGYTQLATLKGTLEHYSYQTKADVTRKSHCYAATSAEDMFRRGIHSKTLMTTILKSGWSFFKTFILYLGILDGREGLEIARMNMQYTYRKYNLLRSMNAELKEKF